ncbi:phenylalanine--tRNA ligase subunit alpha [Oceanibacterium hippocampi]|uniref:Phenylalanine--tRNA ligase alpha subunit n=1 Tax=Oceanibacterium hippocampi TaxID=745714 RepID=A0A1Y5RRL1_9PROT|nr:phenylalanine--tRNA ligase subunit alpha [Oceanibacterium hippocampi]SLN23681.1 Phenylalanine--tRNA ligase alpha subunit [Oceanibacterium hippocampi]
MADLQQLEVELIADIDGAENLEALEAVRVAALGKKGRLSQMMRGLGSLSPEERKAVAPGLNRIKDEVNEALLRRRAALGRAALDARLASERVDVTLPVRPERSGRIHPVSQVMDEIAEIFADMGFNIAEGPDIEDDFHNFTALNIPPEHPARQMHDTFYFNEKADGERMVLRTHTSPVQIRTMQSEKPPHRIVAPGRTYRSDSDQTHTPMFHQIEGLVIDRGIHMGHLKGTLQEFARAFFELDDVEMRFRPSHFPFTEPSAEVDIRCRFEGDSIAIGEGDDWLEILGCGMVHPRVLEHVGLDPEEYQGFAWGMGIDRIAMLKYGIPDLRAFFDSDLRWLRHYGFLPLDMPTLGGGLSR